MGFGDVKDYQEHGGMKGMGESLDRGHVMIFSLWDDVEVNMLWLDSAYPLDKPETDPGIKRGDCPGGEESTPTYLRKTYPNGYVTFKNAAVGETGSTLFQPTQTLQLLYQLLVHAAVDPLMVRISLNVMEVAKVRANT